MIDKDAEAHWEYVKSVLISHGENDETIEKCGFHYRTAFTHGYKHGIESVQEGVKADE